MKEFSYFVANKSVKRQPPDMNIAKAAARDSSERLQMAKNIMGAQKPKYVLENAYEAARELIDAILFLNGYKSYSHEASVSYLLDLGFSIAEAMKLDRLRKQRNGIKYYGENATKDDAMEALKLSEEIIKKLLKKRPELRL